MRASNLGVGPNTKNKDKGREELGIKNGMAHTTDLINYPGFNFTKSITLEYMHGGSQGIDQTHFILYMRSMVPHIPGIWSKFNEWKRNYENF
jgi:hypothetical protein